VGLVSLYTPKEVKELQPDAGTPKKGRGTGGEGEIGEAVDCAQKALCLLSSNGRGGATVGQLFFREGGGKKGSRHERDGSK